MSLLERLLKRLLKEHSIVSTIDWMGYLQQIHQRHKGMMKTLIKKGLKYSINGFLKFGLISMSAASPIFLKNVFSWRSNDQTSITYLFNVPITITLSCYDHYYYFKL